MSSPESDVVAPALAPPPMVHSPQQHKKRRVSPPTVASGLPLLAATAFPTSLEQAAAHAAQYPSVPSPPPPPVLPQPKAAQADSSAAVSAAAAAGSLMDLSGSTSAEVRRMTVSERSVVLEKRKIRNRLSAKRSRARRQATLNDIEAEVAELRDIAARLQQRCNSMAEANAASVAACETLRKEKALLESMLRDEKVADHEHARSRENAAATLRGW